MSDEQLDLTTALFVLPPDARLVELSELSDRVRATLGPTEDGQRVVTRPGFRMTARLLSAVFAELVQEFRVPSLLAVAVRRYAETHGHDALELLDLAFDPLACLIEARILVPEGSPDASAPEPTLGAGQVFAGYEVDALIRSLEDSEVFRARAADGSMVALKIARAGRSAVASALSHEAQVLERLDGIDTPRLVESGAAGGRHYLAMEWCDGESITVAAQRARAAGDWRQAHDLVQGLLGAYARLHARGILHGYVHPGNCFVRDDGRVVLLDFGQARPLPECQAVDPSRAGIPQFYDPQMAEAVLGGVLPPSATFASEQYSIAMLAYLVLAGAAPTAPASGLLELLERIVHWPVQSFASCGIPSWPDVERVVGRALSKQPDARFPSMEGMASAFAQTRRVPWCARIWSDASPDTFLWTLEATRSLEPVGSDPVRHAWFALRAAVVLGDPELLAAADIIVRGAPATWSAEYVAAMVARARSDVRAEKRAVARLLASAETLSELPDVWGAVLAAAQLRDLADGTSTESARLARWACQRVDALAEPAASDGEGADVRALLEMALAAAGMRPVDALGLARLESREVLACGSVWLWSAAHAVNGDGRYRGRALRARLPQAPLARCLAYLQQYQLTGDIRLLAAASRVGERRLDGGSLDASLLLVELRAQERAVCPAFLVPLVVSRPKASDSGAPQRRVLANA